MSKDINNEELVIGSLVIDGNAIIDVADMLQPEHFIDEELQKVYRAILKLYAKGKPIDSVTICNADKTIKASYIAEIANKVPTSSHIRDYADGVIEKYKLLQIQNIGAELIKDAIDGKDVEEIITASQNKILELDQKDTRQLTPDSDYLAKFFDEIDKRHKLNQDNKFVGLTSGFKHLDEVSLGLQGLWVIGAGTSLGKTTFVKELADMVSQNNENVPVLYISYEQSSFELTLKSLSRLSRVDTRAIQKGRLDSDEFERLSEAMGKYSEVSGNIYTIEADNYTDINKIKTYARRILRNHNAEKLLIIIDYLQLIPVRDGFYKSEKEKVDKICSDLKRLSRDLDSPVVAVSSLNRTAMTLDSSKSKRPSLASFKESGGIEYATDIGILMVLDKEQTEVQTSKMGRPVKVIDLDIAKNRNGERATITFVFDLQFATFTEMDKKALKENDTYFG